MKMNETKKKKYKHTHSNKIVMLGKYTLAEKKQTICLLGGPGAPPPPTPSCPHTAHPLGILPRS